MAEGRDGFRLAIGSSVVCIASWLALLAGAGNVGLQRSISKGAVSLIEEPTALILVAVVAFGVSFLVARAWRLSARDLLVGVLVGDALAGLVLAPLLIGELEPIHAPLVFAAVAVLGLQPAAALVGAWLAARRLAGPRSDSRAP